jgi:hypothetical protein
MDSGSAAPSGMTNARGVRDKRNPLGKQKAPAFSSFRGGEAEPGIHASMFVPKAGAELLPAPAPEQFVPVRIMLLNERNLPFPPPFLQFLLAVNRIADIKELLIPDKPRDAVTGGEAFALAFLVLRNAAAEIGGHADVDRAALLARHHVGVTGHAWKLDARREGRQGEREPYSAPTLPTTFEAWIPDRLRRPE